MKLEKRFQSRNSTQTSEGTISGYAAVYDSPSLPLPGGRRGQFVERIAPGAFDKSLEEKRSVKLFFGHNDRDLPLASSPGTLQLESDGKGLRFSADIADTTQGRDVMTLMERGDLGGEGSVSFGFQVVQDEWNEARTTRTLKEVRLYEISIVSEAAYPATASNLRHSPGVKARKLQLSRARLGLIK